MGYTAEEILYFYSLNHDAMNKVVFSITALFVGLFFSGCKPQSGEPVFNPDDPQSLAASLLYAMGGDSLWATNNSLYFRTQVQEQGMESPFVSEEWRDLNAFKLRIEQQNEAFHTIGYFSQSGGWLELVGQDSLRRLADGELVAWWFDHERNFYRMLHRLASGDPELTLQSTESNQLDCLEDGVKLVSFVLDEEKRPSEFHIWPLDAEAPQTFRYSEWGTLPNGMVYPKQGARADSAFSFQMLVWEPSTGIYEAAFDDFPYSPPGK